MDSPTSAHLSVTHAGTAARLLASTSPSRSTKLAGTSSSKALEDAPSSDDTPECTATSSFASSLEAHITSRTRLSLASHLIKGGRRKENWPLGSSSSPLRSVESSKRRRGVAFSATPLGSLNASPKHSPFFHPYHSAQRPNRRIHIYSDPSSSSPPPSSSSPSNRFRRVASLSSSSSLPSPPPELDEATDDEAESSQVVALLLSLEQQLLPSNSPPRSAAVALPSPTVPHLQSPSRTGIRGILKKRGLESIRLVKDAVEGSKRNSGRKKHALNWEECFREVSPSDEEMVDGTGHKKEAPAASTSERGSGAGSKGNGSAPTSGPSASTPAPASAAGATGGDDPNDQHRPVASTSSAPPPPSDTTAPKDSGRIVYNVADLDPVHFASPLLTICASLTPTPLGEGNVRHLSSGSPPSEEQQRLAELDLMLGTNAAASALLTPTTEEPPPPPPVPTLLTDLESAYGFLVRAILRLPPTAEPNEVATTLEPLRKCTAELVRNLERDLSNISSFPTWSRTSLLQLSSSDGSPASPPITSPSATRKGKGKQRVTLPEEQMRRLKDEIGVAQVAVKLLGAICKDVRLFSLFAEEDLARLAKLALAIPSTANLSPSISKDFYPFLAWLCSLLFASGATSGSTTGLSDDFLLPLLPSVITTLSHTLRASDKLRVNLSESLPAVQALVARFPRQVLETESRKAWFKETVGGLWDTGKKGTGVRGKSLAVLCELARFLTRVDEGGSAEESSWRRKVKDEISVDFLAVLSSPAPPTADGQPQTYIHVLEQQMEATLKLGPTGKIDETAYHTLILLLALLPTLLGPRFRKLEPKGIKPFVTLFNKFSEQQSAYMRSLTGLLWTHVARAFLLVGSDASSGEPWIFRYDKKPFSVLTSIFEHRRQGDWSARATSVAAGGIEGLSPARREKHRANAQALAHAVVCMLTGFTTVLFASDLVPSAEIDPLLPESTMKHLDFLFDSLVTPQVTAIIVAPFPLTPVIGWATLASILRPRKEADRTITLDRLVNPVLFDPAIMTTTSKQPNKQELLVQRALRSSCQGEDVPGWGSRWAVSRVEKVLSFFLSVLGEQGEVGWKEEMLENSILPVWRSLLLSFEEVAATSSLPIEQLTTSTHCLVNWVARFLRSAPPDRPASGVSAAMLAHRFVAELFDVLGARLVALEPSELTANSKPWYFLASVLLDTEGPHLMPSTASEASAYSRAVLSVLSAPLDADDMGEVLATVTKQLLAPEIQLAAEEGLYSSFAAEIANRWTSLLGQDDFNLDTASLDILVRLIRVHRDSASWSELSAALTTAAFADDGGSKQLQQCLLASSASPTAPAANMRLVIALVYASRTQTTVVQEALVQLADNAMRLLLLDPQEGYIGLVAQLLEAATDSQLAQLYPVALEGLQPLAEVTSAGLASILPILTPINRAFAITEFDTQASAVVSEATFLAFAKFWEATYDSKAEIAVPAELVDVIKVIKDLTAYPIGDCIGETQTQATQSMRAMRQQESLEEQTLAPRAGQRLRSSRPSVELYSNNSDASGRPEVSGRGYEADASTASPLKTTLASVSTAEKQMPPPPSPSLRGPPTDEAIAAAVPPSPSIAEETPREVIALRARASYAESALLEQSAAEEDAGSRSSVQSSGKKRAASPELRQPTPSRKRRSPSVVSDSDDSDEMYVVSRIPSSQGSASQSKGHKKKVRSVSATPSAVSASTPASSKRRKADAYVDIQVRGKKGAAQEERPNKRSASSQDGSVSKKRKKKSPRADGHTTSKPRGSSPPPRSRSSSLTPADSGFSSSGINSPAPGDTRGDDAVRHLLAMPVETVVRTAAKVGGSPKAAMNRLKELGAQAALYFEALRRSASQ